jgi:hypothetical protein
MASIPLDADHASIARARGLLAAFHDDDAQTWNGIMTADIEAGGTEIHKTFCSMVAFAHELADAVSALSRRTDPPGDTFDQVLDKITAASLHIHEQAQKETHGDDTA